MSKTRKAKLPSGVRRVRSQPLGSGAFTEDAGSLEQRVVSLALGGKLAHAAQKAVRLQKARGLAVTFKRGDAIVKQHSSGRIEKIATIQPRKYAVPAGVRIIGGL